MKEQRKPGRPKGSLNRSTLTKISKGLIKDPRYNNKKHYNHKGRPIEILREANRLLEESKDDNYLRKCKEYATEWCKNNNAELLEYNKEYFMYQDTSYKESYKRGYK